MFSLTSAPLEIEVLLLPQCNLVQLASVIEPLRVANRMASRQLYSWHISTEDGQSITTTSHIPIPADSAFDPAARVAPLFVVASYAPLTVLSDSVIHSLSQARRFRDAIIGIENGVWPMAEAGLLNDCKVAAHWEDADALAAHYPFLNVVSQHHVIDGKRITTAGSLPTLDMMLALIRARQGFAFAMLVSRQFIYTPSGEADNVSPSPVPGVMRAGDRRLAVVIRYMEDNLETPLSITHLAKQAGMSTRRLHMLFTSVLGASPKRYYLALRLNAARRQLIESRLPIAEIAVTSGFTSQAGFSTCYRSSFGETPSETRRTIAVL
ncbi:GlxA family transcriptional regulator [Alphaproteobacteria bacterium]|nr:GlxA family transcriptional regulator [Alphaproteobacteria bacterium]